MPKLLVGVGGVLTERQKHILIHELSKHVKCTDIIPIPFMNGSIMIEGKYVKEISVDVKVDGPKTIKSINKSKV